ncbi:DUF6285 domain-containing protein [Pseudomonas silvicola]|nr:DUF6285 domain-containing protein [Pseudomonas silvicola]
MRRRPDGADLLAAAQRLLRGKLLEALGDAHKHDGLMIANAMAVAARQLEAGDTPALREHISLLELLGGTHPHPLSLAEGSRELGRRLRAGAADPGQPGREALLAHLRDVTRQQVLESNPKYFD